MSIKVKYIFVTLIIAGALNAFAQNAQELQVGSFITGNLKAGQDIWYSVRAADNSILTVETTGSTDTFLEAYDNNRNKIREDDDGGSEYNAKIELLAAAGRTYLFKLRCFDSDESGPFRILATQSAPIVELRSGASQNGRLASGANSMFSVRASVNGFIIVETSADFDTTLDAYNNNLDHIAFDDDGGEGNNSRIEVDAVSGRVYYFKLSGFEGEGGSYRINANSKPYPAPVPITFGTFQSGTITAGGDFWYSVRPTRRGKVNVGTAGSTDTYLRVYSDSYELIAENDDTSDDDYNANITFDVDANKTYIIRLKGFDSDVSGPFRLFISFE